MAFVIHCKFCRESCKFIQPTRLMKMILPSTKMRLDKKKQVNSFNLSRYCPPVYVFVYSLARFFGLRQQAEKMDPTDPYMCISDFVAPAESGKSLSRSYYRERLLYRVYSRAWLHWNLCGCLLWVWGNVREVCSWPWWLQRDYGQGSVLIKMFPLSCLYSRTWQALADRLAEAFAEMLHQQVPHPFYFISLQLICLSIDA